MSDDTTKLQHEAAYYKELSLTLSASLGYLKNQLAAGRETENGGIFLDTSVCEELETRMKAATCPVMIQHGQFVGGFFANREGQLVWHVGNIPDGHATMLALSPEIHSKR